jgi:hypothetical protein
LLFQVTLVGLFAFTFVYGLHVPVAVTRYVYVYRYTAVPFVWLRYVCCYSLFTVVTLRFVSRWFYRLQVYALYAVVDSPLFIRLVAVCYVFLRFVRSLVYRCCLHGLVVTVGYILRCYVTRLLFVALPCLDVVVYRYRILLICRLHSPLYCTLFVLRFIPHLPRYVCVTVVGCLPVIVSLICCFRLRYPLFCLRWITAVVHVR